MLNQRCINILMTLIEEKSSTVKELAKKYNITERSIRYDIDNINYYLYKNGLKEIEKKSKGILKFDEDKEKTKRLIEILNRRFYNFSQHERKEYIKSFILFTDDIINLHEISEILSVSLSTVKLDFKEVKLFLKENGMSLKYLSKLGLKLEGDEERIRKAQLKMLVEYLDISKDKFISKIKKDEVLGYKLIRDELKLYFEDYPLRNIRIFIKRVENELGTIISDEAYKVLEMYLLIAIRRLENENEIKNRENNEKFLKSTKEYKILSNELNMLSEYFNIKFNDYEKLLLTELFLGSHSYNFNSSFYENWIEIEISVNEIIKEVSRKLEIDLTKDKILYDGILNHLKPAIYRIKNDIILENEVVKEIKEIYNELFDIIKEVSNENLKLYINKDLPDEEISYLTMHFKTALDRKENSENQIKNILIICGLGYGSSKLIAQKLLENYDVNIIDTLPYHKFLDIKNFDNIDLIISTLEIDEKLDYPFPILKVNPIFTNNDKKRLEEYGLKKNSNKISLTKLLDIIKSESKVLDEENLIGKLKNFFKSNIYDDRYKIKDKKLIDLLQVVKVKESVENWEEAIKEAGKELLKIEAIEEEYIEEMIKAVKIHGSYMIVGGKVALPHARIKNQVKYTAMTMIKLNKEVEFPEGKKVKIIIAFSSKDRSEHVGALTELVELIENYDFVKKIENSQREEEIIKYITEINSEE